MTLANCAAFPFLWRIDQEFGIGGDDGEEKLRHWLDKCKESATICRTIPSQGWCWWWEKQPEIAWTVRVTIQRILIVASSWTTVGYDV